MFHYNLLEKPSFNINTHTIDKIFKNIDKTEAKIQSGTLNIVFVDNDSIKNLNKTYRNKDQVTDVLSFHYYEDFNNLSNDEIAGELIFCEEQIKIQAQEYKLGEEKEFYKLLIHSILHILGYDHERDDEYEIMQSKENHIWREIFGE